MDGYVRLAVLLIASPVGMFGGHVTISRVCSALGYRPAAPQSLAMLVVLLGNIPFAWLSWWLALGPLAAPARISGLICMLVAYNMLAFCYLNVLNASETSLHIHILMMLLAEREISMERLTRQYSAAELLKARVERLIALGQLRRQGSRFVLSNRTFLVLEKVLVAWRGVLGLPVRPDEMPD